MMAALAIVMLLVGLAVGYLAVPRPAAPSEPGPVDDLARGNTVPRVQGWYRDSDVAYLDYGPMPNVAVPILVFFQAASPDTAVSGQRNVIDTIPGQPGYSDFWRVFKVLAPADYVANTIRSFEEAVASGYPMEATDLIVNCPVVNPEAAIQGSAARPVPGWYRGRGVHYFDHGANSPGEGFVVQDAPLWAFFHQDGSPVAGQRNVIDVKVGDAGYSDLWRVTKVIVGPGYMPNTLKSATSIMAEASAGNVTLEPTDLYVNCPVVP